MGPEATVELLRRIVAATPARDDGDHVHLIVDSIPHVPSRIAALVDGDGESPAPELTRMAKRLVHADAGVLVIACNTAHAYVQEIRAAAGEAIVLDMVELAARAPAARRPPLGRVGLPASTAAQRTGLYARVFAANGLECVFPKRQARVMEIIKAVKRGAAGEAERADLADVSVSLAEEGVDALVIACTEISCLSDALPGDLAALDLLVAEIVRLGTSPRG